MNKKIRRLLKEENYRKMLSNFSYLAIINIANKFLPLLVIPYIIRTIGVEKYGIIVFMTSVVSYFGTLISYSFGLTATKYISQYREDKEKISVYFWDVLGAQLFLFLLSFFIVSLMVVFVDKLYIEKEVLFFSFFILFSTNLVPLWFFRGIEEMKYIAIFEILSKVIYTVLVFYFIENKNDYVWIPLLNAISFLVVGIYAMHYIHKKLDIKYRITSLNKVIELLKEGRYLFYSNINVVLYSTTNTVLLGLLTSYSAVGVYGLAITIYGAYSQIIKTYNTVIYPHLARYANDLTMLTIQARKFLKLYMIVLVGAALFLLLSSDFFIKILFGEGHETSVLVLKIRALALAIDVGGFFSSYMAIKSSYKIINQITLKTMFFNFIIIVPFIMLYEEIGLAIALLTVSIFHNYLNIKNNKELIRS